MIENTTVEETQALESVPDDAAQAPETNSDNETIMALSDLLAEHEEEAADANAPETQEPSEQQEAQEADKPVSGGIKGRLLASEKKGEERGYQNGYAAAKAEYEKKLADQAARLEKLDELELREAAAQIVKEEGCSEKLAMRLARMERGLPPQAETPGQPRDASGRFVKTEQANTNDVKARAQFLFDQSKTVQRATGVDVMSLFNSDEDVRHRVLSGEADFADIAREYGGQSTKKAAPPVVRSSSGSTVKARTFADLSDEEFDRFQSSIGQGKVLDLRR